MLPIHENLSLVDFLMLYVNGWANLIQTLKGEVGW